MKIRCQACELKFRHYYLYIRHVRKMTEIESENMKKTKSNYSPHLGAYTKIMSRCDAILNKYK